MLPPPSIRQYLSKIGVQADYMDTVRLALSTFRVAVLTAPARPAKRVFDIQPSGRRRPTSRCCSHPANSSPMEAMTVKAFAAKVYAMLICHEERGQSKNMKSESADI